MNDHTRTVDHSQFDCLASLFWRHLFSISVVLLGTLAVDNGAAPHAAEKGVPQDESGIRNAPKVKVRPVSEHRKYFEMLAQTAHCFEYSGAWTECWIEVEMDGEVTRFGEVVGQSLREYREAPAKVGNVLPEPSGRILWVIRREGSKEVWDLAISVRHTDRSVYKIPCKGIVPPQVSGRYRGRPRPRYTPGADGAIVLYTLEHTGNETDQIVRSAKLMCRALD
jgi:hypothetical protein